MVCLGLEPRAAGWKAQMNPLSYGGPLYLHYINLYLTTTILYFLIYN